MSSEVASQKFSLNADLKIFNRVTLQEKVVFCKEIATMLKSGLHLTQALVVLRNQSRNKFYRTILDQIKTDIEEGAQFSTALQKYPNVFDRVIISVARSGEVSGQLDKQLNDLGDELDRQYKFQSKLKSAMAYPALVVVLMVIVGLIAAIKIIPALQSILEESGAELPWYTKVVLAISNIITHQWYIILFLIVLGVVGYNMFRKSESGKLIRDRWLITGPSRLSIPIYMARLTRTLGILIQAGVPIVDALKIVSDVMNNRVYQYSLTQAASELEKGIPLSSPLQKDAAIYPPYVIQMLIIGEQTGQTDRVMLGLAEYYEEQSEQIVRNLSTWLEPVMIVIVGLGVAFLAFAVLMPVYNAALSIK